MENRDRDRATQFLVERGAGNVVLHHRSLLEHLVGTEQLLRRWGCSDTVAVAGLCHAAYGTDGLAEPLVALDQRPTLRDLIGPAAESAVYVYGCCDRTAVYPQLGVAATVRWRDRFTGEEWAVGDEQLSTFLLLTWANALEAAAAGTDADWSAVRYLMAMTADLVGPEQRRSAAETLGLDLSELA